MAKRKPSNVADDIVGGIRKIVSPWLGAPPAQNKQVTQAQGLARGAAETLDQAFAGGMVKAGVQGNQALVKQAAINAAALGTGYVAGKAAVTAVGAVAKTGVPARVMNKVKGQTVGLHGSPISGLKSIDPRISRSDTDIPTVSFVRTDIPPSLREHNVNITKSYANKEIQYNTPIVRSVEGINLPPDQGSIYVVKANKATSNLPDYKDYVKGRKAPVQYNEQGRPMLYFPPTAATKTTTSAKVFAEIPVNKYPTEDLLNAEIRRQTRLAGSSMRTKSLRDKVEEAARKKAMKQRDKKSVI